LLGRRRRQYVEVAPHPVRALILGGGGARGAYEAGVVAALTERESFDIVCGTSIGAVNGMLVAQDEPDRLIHVWSNISERGVTQLRPELSVLVLLWQAARGLFSSPFAQKGWHALSLVRALPQLSTTTSLPGILGLFESANVHEVIEEIAHFERLSRVFIAGVTNLSTGRGESFAYFPPALHEAEMAFHRAEHAEPMTAENYVGAVCASAALPPVYEPVEILCADGVARLFADGGFTNNAPIREAIDAGATDVTAIFVGPAGVTANHDRAASLLDVATIMLEANTERMLELDLKLARRINDDVVAGHAPGKRHINFRIIGPSAPLEHPTLGFNDQEEVNRLFALGYADGRQIAAA
jgi:predicted acylesterase/phospholipase RssA